MCVSSLSSALVPLAAGRSAYICDLCCWLLLAAGCCQPALLGPEVVVRVDTESADSSPPAGHASCVKLCMGAYVLVCMYV